MTLVDLLEHYFAVQELRLAVPRTLKTHVALEEWTGIVEMMIDIQVPMGKLRDTLNLDH